MAHFEQVWIYTDFPLNILICSLNSFPSPVTAPPHCHRTGVCSSHLSLPTSLDAKEKEEARMTEGSPAFATVKKGWFYCHRTLQSQTLEMIGDVRLLHMVPHTTSNQPALRIEDYTRQESWESSQKGLLWRNARRVMGRYKAYGHFREVTILNSW